MKNPGEYDDSIENTCACETLLLDRLDRYPGSSIIENYAYRDYDSRPPRHLLDRGVEWSRRRIRTP